MFLCLVHDRVLPTGLSDLAARTPNRLRAAGTAYQARHAVTEHTGLAA